MRIYFKLYEKYEFKHVFTYKSLILINGIFIGNFVYIKN